MMHRKTRPTAKLLIVAVACVALVVGLVGLGFGLISRVSGSASDSVDEALAAIGDDPQAALEYLAPEEDGNVDEDGVWVPGQTTVAQWTMLTSRDWHKHAPGLDALTAVTGALSSVTGVAVVPVGAALDGRSRQRRNLPRSGHFGEGSRSGGRDDTQTGPLKR